MNTRVPGPSDEQRLSRLFRELPKADRATLLAFAEFLVSRAAPDAQTPSPRDPQPIPRPAKESVVAAIKRLARTYDMLDRNALLNDTSALMSAHVLQGRSAAEVIDELESVFARHYKLYRDSFVPPGTR